MKLTIADNSPFTLQNLPYGVFRPDPGQPARIGVAIGEWVLDLAALDSHGLFDGPELAGHKIFAEPSLNAFMALGRPAWIEARATLMRHLVRPAMADRPLSREVESALRPLADVELLLPAAIGDYTDFYSSREHATNVGTMFRGVDNALMPNWLRLPVAYHGRAGTIIPSGRNIVRPRGQSRPAGSDAPLFAPSVDLDFELEMGFFVGPGSPLGKPIPVESAADHIFGLVLVNDWSARDIQRWEYQPLGPFLGKNFATSISPWVVPLLALEPFRVEGPQQDPQPLPYLQGSNRWTFDIELQATLQSRAMAEAGLEPMIITRTNFRYLYWNMAQQLAHHTINGCSTRPGDLMASGTISGPDAGSYGSLLELTWGGKHLLELPTGETRRYLEDGDRLTLSGWCEGDDARIGFGEVTAMILPAIEE